MTDPIDEIIEQPAVAVLLEILRLCSTETYLHSLSVAHITETLLDQANESYSKKEKEEILTGALLHDVGKAFLPFNLTQLPSALSSQEYQIIKVHAALSYEIVKVTFPKIVQEICLYHHEKPDGSGYLGGINLRTIPDYVLLVQVADVYDALTSERSYKKKYSSEQALAIMERDAEQFLLDDEYVDLLKNIILNGGDQND